MNEIRSRFVMVNGVRTHYSETGGDGPVIVGMHGGGSGSSGAAGMGPIMTRLPENYRFIALDSVGGFGLTDPEAPAPYGLKARVEHLAAFVEVIGLETFTIMGNSQGAWCAARYATLRPDRVERLVMVGSATLAQSFGMEVEVTDSMKKMFAFDGSRNGMLMLARGLVHDPSAVSDALIDMRMHSANRPGASESFARAQAGTRELQTNPILRSYFAIGETIAIFTEHKPTLIIWGENDSFAVPELGRAVQNKLPAARFAWVKNAGHQVQTDQPALTAKLLLDFITGADTEAVTEQAKLRGAA